MKQTFPVLGMACTGCAAMVEKALRQLPGIRSANVSLACRSVLVDYDERSLTPAQMRDAVGQAGYHMVVEQETRAEQLESIAWKHQLRLTLIAWCLTIATAALSWTGGEDNAQWALLTSLACLCLCGRQFYIKAAKQISCKTLGMDALVALSTAITFIWNTCATFSPTVQMAMHACYDTPPMILAFVLTGKLLEQKALGGAASGIRHLMQMAPRTAHVVQGNVVNDVPIAAIGKGDCMEVKAGERIPVDGLALQASSFMDDKGAYVDESMMTGEPTPSCKRRGDRLLAGTLLQQGQLRMTATTTGADTALARMTATVQQAMASKAPVQRIADKVAAIFVPAIAAISLVTLILWWAIGGQAMLPQAIICAVSVLVIACPCAMGLATPAALMAGIGRAANLGILIKDATALERIRRISAIVLDKTGTLTSPTPAIDFTQADGLSPEQRETLKPNSPKAVSQLKEMGIVVHLMSGDREDAVQHWAQACGIDHWRHGVTADDKERLVSQLQAEGHVVAMAGDGINDTPALARADVSVAMGQGTDAAMDAAQITLAHGDLLCLPQAIKLSRRASRRIRQNLAWAFAYNIACIPIAAGLPIALGLPLHITPSIAAALMAVSSLSVLLNSLRP